MSAHGDREHARWAASSTQRNWNCPGAIAQIESITTPEKENRAAAWGTACHQLSEKCLTDGREAIEFLGGVETTKEHTIPIDEELADTAQQYVDYVRKQAKGDWTGRPCPGCAGHGIATNSENERNCAACAGTGEEHAHATLQIEQRFTLNSLKPPYESGGTADAVLYTPARRHLEVVDLKGGRGVVVEVEDNKQLRTYALGAVLANPGLDVEKVTVTIVQPRAPHKDGRIRSETFHIADLMEWTADLLAAMHRSKSAQAEFGKIPLAAWSAKYLVAGDHCKFCRAAGFCPALEQRAVDAAGVWFNDEDQPKISNAPDAMAPAELAKKLDMFDMISEWMNAVRAYAQQQAESGVVIPSYQLTETIGHRKFKDESAVKELLFLRADLTENDVYTKKFMSPAQIEKTLGAKRLRTIKTDLDALIERPKTGTSLVRADKTTRPAIAPAVNKHFAPIED